MHKAVAIAKVTAHEVLSEPLSLLVTLTSLALVVMAPTLHYHQFGEATRMARDAGFSALFLGGAVFAVFGTIKSFRRELESGTADMALAHSVSRGGFFLAKVLGAALAYLVFFLTILGVALLMVEGAFIGGVIADRTGAIAKVFGPCVAGGATVILLPLLVAAALNRFARFRFVLSFHVLALVLGLVAMVFALVVNLQLAVYLPVAVLVSMPALVLLTAAAAFSTRMKANKAASLTALVVVALLPAIGNYYLADALSRGGTVPLSYVGAAVAAALPAMAFFLRLMIK